MKPSDLPRAQELAKTLERLSLPHALPKESADAPLPVSVRVGDDYTFGEFVIQLDGEIRKTVLEMVLRHRDQTTASERLEVTTELKRLGVEVDG